MQAMARDYAEAHRAYFNLWQWTEDNAASRAAHVKHDEVSQYTGVSQNKCEGTKWRKENWA